jgi:iron(III) transport system substrate-binding protein
MIRGAAAALASGTPWLAGAQANAEWSQVVDAGRKEGKLTIYSASVGQTNLTAVSKLFERQYGIDVSILEGRASEIRERIRAEQAAGRYLCDVSHNGATTSGLQAAAGNFQPHGKLPNLHRIRKPFEATEFLVPEHASAYGILVNTNLVKPGEEPKSWADLANPRWKGKILSDDPRTLGGGSMMFFVTYDKLGRGFHEKLAANHPVFSRDSRASERRVARGEYAIWVPMTSDAFAKLQGLPVKFIVPREGLCYVAFDLAIAKNAPHSNAARLFLDFSLSDSAQLIQQQAGYAMVTDVKAPPGPLAGVKLMGTTESSRQEEMLRFAKDIYK